MTSSPAPLLTKKDAAQFLAISVKTVSRIIADRKSGLRHIRIGGQVRFEMDDILTYVRNKKSRIQKF